MEFATPLDIWNRALQHCGRIRVGSLTEPTAQANEIRSCYNKLRAAELRRNVWRFAIRRAMLRPLTVTTVLWTPPAWAAATSYALGAVVSYGGFFWQVDQAITGAAGNPTPDVATAWHRYFGPITLDTYDSTSSYTAGELAVSSGTIYLSLVSANTAAPPSANWLAANGTTLPLQIVYPIGSGPAHDTTTRNVFRLPYGFLRRAPQNPGSTTPFLGGPDGFPSDDWAVEGNYIVTEDFGPLMLRFVADVTDTYDMDDMFCEGLSARIATEVAPSLVEGKELGVILASVRNHYATEMAEARLVNGIETGPTEPPEDDFILVRY